MHFLMFLFKYSSPMLKLEKYQEYNNDLNINRELLKFEHINEKFKNLKMFLALKERPKY